MTRSPGSMPAAQPERRSTRVTALMLLQCAPLAASLSPPEPPHRIDRPPTLADLEVELGPLQGPRLPHRGDGLAASYLLADRHQRPVEVRVEGIVTPVVVEDDGEPVAAVPVDVHDLARLHRLDRGAADGADVDPVVHDLGAIYRMDGPAEARHDLAVDRPVERAEVAGQRRRHRLRRAAGLLRLAAGQRLALGAAPLERRQQSLDLPRLGLERLGRLELL